MRHGTPDVPHLNLLVPCSNRLALLDQCELYPSLTWLPTLQLWQLYRSFLFFSFHPTLPSFRLNYCLQLPCHHALCVSTRAKPNLRATRRNNCNTVQAEDVCEHLCRCQYHHVQDHWSAKRFQSTSAQHCRLAQPTTSWFASTRIVMVAAVVYTCLWPSHTALLRPQCHWAEMKFRPSHQYMGQAETVVKFHSWRWTVAVHPVGNPDLTSQTLHWWVSLQNAVPLTTFEHELASYLHSNQISVKVKWKVKQN